MAAVPAKKMSKKASIGERVRLLRQAKGLSLEQMERLTGIDWSGLARRERGERQWTSTDLEAVAKALGVPVANLFGG